MGKIEAGWILLIVGLGIFLLVGVIITVCTLSCMARRKKKLQEKSKSGIAGNTALVSALQQSFAYQAQALAAQIEAGNNMQQDEECLTCNLIQMGSSMAYSDNTCPQCGRRCV